MQQQRTADVRNLREARDAKPQNRPGDFENWAELAKHVDTPATAFLVVDFFNKAPELKLRHAGLYLRAANVVQRCQAEQQKLAAQADAAKRAIWQARIARASKMIRAAGHFGFRCVRLLFRLGGTLIQMGVSHRKVPA